MTLLPHRDTVGKKNTSKKNTTTCNSAGCNRAEINPDLMCQVESLEPRILLSGSDLWVSAVTAPTNAMLSSEITVSWTVENIGDQPTDSSWGWYDQVFLSEDDQLDPDHFEGDAMLGEYSYYGDDLQPGDSYTAENITLNLPGGYDGDVYLLFVTDYWDYEIEGDEANNVHAVQINVTSPDVDLQITNASAPLSAGAGSALDLSWTVANTGTADAAASEWVDSIYLSTDTVLDEWDDYYISETWIYGGVGAGSSYTENQTFSAPNVTPGDYYLIIGTDIGFTNNQAETNESNNFYTLPITITQPDIDLEISAVAPATAGQGEQVYFEWTVTNTGQDTAAGQWSDSVYISADAILDTNTDFYVASAWIDGSAPLAYNESYVKGSYGFLPADISGDVYIIYAADVWDNQAESDNDNNYYAVPYYITPVSVDLDVTDTTLQSSIYPGEYFNFSWEVTNTGTSSATSDWYDYIYLSTDTLVDYNDVQLNYFNAGGYSPLAASDSYTLSTYFTMPGDTVPGDYYILIHTDGGGYSWQMESDEDNNVEAVPVQVGMADLTITSGSAPAAGNPGSTVDVTWTTHNAGNVDAAAPWYESVYLSDDSVYNTGDTQLAYFYIDQDLAAGESREQTQTITLPDGAEGNYLIVVTDPWWEVSESDETNNQWSSPINIGSVDLTVTDADAPTQAVLGETINVTYTIENSGTAPTTAWYSDRFYLSDDNLLDAGDITLTYSSASSFLPLGSGDSYSTSTTLALNSGTPGSKYILVVADGYNYQAESDEDNNVRALPLTLTAPDLTAAGTAPASAGWGETISVSWTVTNDGDGPATRGWYDKIYLSDDINWDPGTDDLLATRWTDDVQPLDPAASYGGSTTVTVPSGRTGTQYILFVTNTTNSQPESDTTNNVAYAEITLDGADLAISGTDAAVTSANWGENVGVWWTVTNIGNRPATSDWYDYIYLSDDTEYDESDTYLTRVGQGGTLPFAIGDDYTTNTSITIPAGHYGQKHLLVVANGSPYSYDSQAETDSTNNTQSVPITIYAPNLTISQPDAPVDLSWGHPATVSWTVTNTGDGTALSNWVDRIYLSLDDQYDASDISMGSYSAYSQSPLASGEMYNVSQDYTVPGSFTGAGYLIIKLDSSNAQPESDEQDNTVALPVNITAPDLAISAPTAPAEAVWGQSITAQWTVTNIGDGQTANNWYDNIYFSTDDQLSADDINAAAKWAGSYLPLNSGDSYTTSNEFIVPTSFEGAGYILIAADGYNYLAETDEANNVIAMAINLAAPNLTMVDASAPTDVIFGEQIDIDWRVENNSASDAESYWMDEVWLSDDAVYDQNDILMTQTWVTEGLAVGEEYAKTRKISIRQGSIGQQYLLVISNRSASQGESDYTDNIIALPINLSAPDLEISNPSVPSQATWGEAFDVSWTVTNVGNVTAPAYWTDGVYLSTDDVWGAGDQFLASESTWNNDPLTPGASYTFTRSVVIWPYMAMTGDLYVLINADISNAQSETDETNNLIAIPISVGSPDLTVTSASTESTATFGQSVDLTWTVENTGDHATTDGWVDRVYLSEDPVYGGDQLIGEFPVLSEDIPLDASGSYTRNESVMLPLTEQLDAGTYYLIVATDKGYAVAELSEDNNMATTGVLDIALPSLPDLVVSSISGPATGHSGQSVELSWTLTNNGTDAATGSWVDRVYISDDDEIGTDRLIASFRYTGTIAAGESLDRTQTVVLPTDLQGQAWFVVRTNETGELFEHTATDNNASITTSPVDVTLYAPNLQVTAVTPPQEANSGQQATVEFTVTNVGNAATSSPIWYDRVYLSLDDTYQGGDTWLATVNNISYLNPGDSYVGSASFTIPEGVEGQYYFVIVTDAYNYVAELEHEDDNIAAGTATTINLTPPPDLQVASARSIGTAFSGQPITVEWTVVNDGDSPTQSDWWWDRLYLSQDNQIDPWEDLLVSSNHHSGRLMAGESYTVSTTASLPVDASGDWHLLIQLDSSSQVFEHTFELNNVYDLPLPITLTPPPDLEVTDIVVPTEAVSGQSMQLAWTVANYGATATAATRWSDGIYLSTDTTFDPAEDIHIADVIRYGALGTSQSYTRDETITVPHGLEGQYNIIVVADRADAVFELDNDNNTLISIAETQVLFKPADLVVSQLNAPTAILAGQGIYVDWTIANQGLAATTGGTWYDRLILSSDQTVSGDDLMLGQYRHDGNIADGESYTRNDFVVIPSSWAGDGYIIAVTDHYNSVVETNAENNNTAEAAVSISQFAPDLVISSVTVPTAIGSGQSMSVDFTVINNGDGYTSNSWYDRVYLTTDGIIDGPDDIQIGQIRHIGQLAPGAQYDVSVDLDIGIDLSGEYTVVVATDVYEHVSEGAGENNNTTAAQDQLNISLTPVADLTVSDITTDATLVSGQTFNLQYTVNNIGAGDVDSARYDAYYFSRDLVFDYGNDTYLGYQWRNETIASGEGMQASVDLTVPAGLSGPMYIFVVTDNNRQIYERDGEDNNVGYSDNAVQVNVAPPADLVAGQITIPEGVVPGQNVSLTYTVANDGDNTATGSWYDALYLSADTTWDIGDRLIGRAYHAGDVNPGENYSETLIAPLPGVNPGQYHVILRSDIRNNVDESSESNNFSASLDQADIDAEALQLSTPSASTLKQGFSRYYKVDVPAGQTLLVSLDSQSPDDANRLFISYGRVPTTSDFDLASTGAFVADVELVVPTTEAGTYYIMVQAELVLGSEQAYDIAADLIPYSVRQVASETVGDTGPVTLKISGARLTVDSTFELIGPGGVVHVPTAMHVVDPSLAYATFDLAGAELGEYDVRAIDAQAGLTHTLTDGLTVIDGVGSQIDARFEGPSSVRAGAHYQVGLYYGNLGDADGIAPLIWLANNSGTNLGVTPDGLVDSAGWLFLGSSSEGPAGVLRPGELYTIPLYFQVSTDAIDYDAVSIYHADDIGPIDWDYFEPGVRRSEMNDEQWALVWDQVKVNVGDTMGELVQALAANATIMPDVYGSARHPGNLLQMEVERAAAQVTNSISGQLSRGDLNIDIAGRQIFATRLDGGETFQSIVRNDGTFYIANLMPGTYTLAIEGAVIEGDAPTWAVPDGERIADVSLTLVNGATVGGIVRSFSTGQTLAGATVLVTSGTGLALYAQTDAAGRYSLEGLDIGSYTVSVSFDGLATDNQVFDIASLEDNLSVDLTMTEEARMSGQVDFADNGPAISLTVIAVSQTHSSNVFTLTTEQDTFTLDGLPADTYDLVLVNTGYQTVNLYNIVVTAAADVDLGLIDMPLAASLSGQVISHVTGITPGMVDLILYDGNTELDHAVPASDGYFYFTNFGPGTYRIELAEGLNYVDSSITLSVTDGQSLENLSIGIYSGAIVSGVVRDTSSGQPVAGMTVNLIDADGQSRAVVSDASGFYSFDRIEQGTVYVKLASGSVDQQSIDITDTDNQVYTADFNYDYSSAAKVSGILRDTSGDPIAYARAALYQNGQFVVGAVADELGRYEFVVYQPGNYDLLAVSGDVTFTSISGLSVADGQQINQDLVAGTGTMTVSISNLDEDESATVYVYRQLAGRWGLADSQLVSLGASTTTFSQLAAGPYRVQVVSSDERGDMVDVVLSEGQAISCNVTLKEYASMSGVVRKNGEPLAGAEVAITLADGSGMAMSTITNSNGYYSLPQINPDVAHSITVMAEGCETYTSSMDPSGAVTIIHHFSLTASGSTLSGRALDVDGQVLSGALVTVTDLYGNKLGTTITSSDGSFSLTTAVGDNLTVQVTAAGYQTQSQSDVSVGNNESVNIGDVSLMLLGESRYTGDISLATEDPLPAMPASDGWVYHSPGKPGWLDALLTNQSVLVSYTYAQIEALTPPAKCPQAIDAKALLAEAWKMQDASYQWVKENEDVLSSLIKAEAGASLVNGLAFSGKIASLALNVQALRGAVQAVKLIPKATASQAAFQEVAEHHQAIREAVEALFQAVTGSLSDVSSISSSPTPESAAGKMQAVITVISDCMGLLTNAIGTLATLMKDKAGAALIGGAGAMFGLINDLMGIKDTFQYGYDAFVEGYNGLMAIIDAKNRLGDAKVLYQKNVAAYYDTVRYYNATLAWCKKSDDPNPPKPPKPPKPPVPPPGYRHYQPGVWRSLDPNDILGPAGYGEENFVNDDAAFNYTIRFENDATATAPARTVVITQQLDDDLDWRTFRIDDLGWGDFRLQLDADMPILSRRVDMTDSAGFLVDVTAYVDIVSGVATWKIETIDPATGEPPLDPSIGFLPPDDGSGIGQGFVTYTIKPKSDAVTGTRIDAEATIVFDTEAPLATPPIFNTLDVDAPTSSVTALPAVTGEAHFNVSWAGDDSQGAGIKSFDLYVSKDDGAFEPWLMGVNITEAVYQGEIGHRYAFYSIARDGVDNTEAAPAVFDTRTYATTGAVPPTADDDVVTLPEDSPATEIIVLGNDTALPDVGQELTITGIIQPQHGVVVITGNGTGLTYQPHADYYGPDSFTYEITDTDGLTDTASVAVNVTNTGDDPVANDDAITVNEDAAPAVVNVLGNDNTLPDPLQTMTITAITQPANGQVVITGQGAGLTYQPDADFFGSDSFTYTITDADGLTATASVNVTVNGRPDAPSAADDVLAVDEDSPAVSVAVLDNDTVLPDAAQSLAITGVTQPAHGVVVITGDGTGLTYQPDGNYAGADLFTYTVTDGDGLTDTATVSVTVDNVAPSIISLTGDANIDEDQQAAFTASAIDVVGDGESLEYTWDFGDGSDSVSGIDLTAVNHTYTQPGDYTATVTVTDAQGDQDQATWDIHVNEVIPPVVTDVTIDDGSSQMALVRGVTVRFDQPVTLDSDAVVVTNASGQAQPLAVDNPSGDTLTYVITFTDPALADGSLDNGAYTMTIVADKVHNQGGVTLTADYVTGFTRLAGDVTGDGQVGLLDLDVLGRYFGQDVNNVSEGDMNGDGRVSLLDLDILGRNYGNSAMAVEPQIQSGSGLNLMDLEPAGQQAATAPMVLTSSTDSVLADLLDDENEQEGVRLF